MMAVVTKLRNSIFPTDKNLSEVVGGTVATAALKFASMGMTFFLMYIISNRYGAKTVGIFNILLSVLMIGAVIGTFGLGTAILRFSAQYGLQDELTTLKLIYKKIIIITTLVSICIALVVLALSSYLSHVLLKNADWALLFIIIGVTMPFLALNTINAETIRGLKKIKGSELVRSFNINFITLLIFLIITSLISFNMSLPILSYCIAILITFFFSTNMILKQLSKLSISEMPNHTVNLTEIIKVSFPMFLVIIMNLVTEQAGILTLSYYRTSEEVGIFSVASKLANITSFILLAVNTVLGPKIAELFWGNNIAELKNVIAYSSKFIFWLSAPILISYVLFPEFFLSFFGKEFFKARGVLVILSIGQFVNAFCGSVGYFLMMTGNQNFFKNVVFLGMIFNIVINLVSIPHYGIFGASVATVVPIFICNILPLMYIRYKYGIKTYYSPLRGND